MDSLQSLLISLLPALMVTGITWYMLNGFFAREKQAAPTQSGGGSGSVDLLAMKLQAYERLTLMCERCDFMPLIMRMQTAEMSADQLHASLMIGVTQEFDHNVTQQIYISDMLWKLISSARAETLELLSTAKRNAGTTASREAYIDAVLQLAGQMGTTPFQQGLNGIRFEANAVIATHEERKISGDRNLPVERLVRR
jgi:hypothetical protein